MNNSMMLPSEIEQNILAFNRSLKQVESMVQPLLEQPLTTKTSKLDPESRAKVNLCCAYTVNTLFYLYLKTQGINPDDHPIKQEIARIQLYFKKLKERSNKASAASSNDNSSISNNHLNNNNNTTTNVDEASQQVSSNPSSPSNNTILDGDNKKRKNKASDSSKRKKKK